MIIAAAQRSRDKRNREPGETPQLAFTVPLNATGLVQRVMFHRTSMRWLGDNSLPNTSVERQGEGGSPPRQRPRLHFRVKCNHDNLPNLGLVDAHIAAAQENKLNRIFSFYCIFLLTMSRRNYARTNS